MNYFNKPHLRIGGAIFLAGSAMLPGCKSKMDEGNNQPDQKEGPNIVLVVTDDHGRDDAGCYGNTAIHTPNLDSLAARGVRFTRAYCTSPSCSASRSVILTGMYNHANGQYGHGHQFHHFRSFENIQSLPVLLSDGGYHTARIGKYHVDPEEVYHFDTVIEGNSRNAVEMARNCKEYIENQDQPFFLYFCTSDPHRGLGVVEDNPYKPDRFGNLDEGYPGVEKRTFHPDSVIVPPYLPDNRACREELAQYYESVDRFDQGLGKLFQYIKDAGKWDNTVIIYVSDNGIAFPGAKTTTYDPGIHLPCIIRYPFADNAGTVSDAMINWADLTPTILDITGNLDVSRAKLKAIADNNERWWENPPVNEDFHGKSFKKVLETGQDEDWNKTYASHTFHEITMYYPMRVVMTDKYKLIWNVAWQLPFPHASDLFESATWQSVLDAPDQMYANKSIEKYNQRDEFELFDMEKDPAESNNLAGNPEYKNVLDDLVEDLKTFQQQTNDPWFVKWERRDMTRK